MRPDQTYRYVWDEVRKSYDVKMTDNTPITKQQAQELVNMLEMQYLKETQALTITHMKLEYYKRLLSNFEKLEAE